MCGLHRIFSNYWIRLSWIWKILQNKEGVIHHLQNSSYPTKAKFNNCFIIYSNYFQTLKGEHELFVFLLIKNNTTSSPGFLGQRFNNLQWAALLTPFWRHQSNNLQCSGCTFDVIGSMFGQQQLVMVNYVCGFNQSEREKYFEWIIRFINILLWCMIYYYIF